VLLGVLSELQLERLSSAVAVGRRLERRRTGVLVRLGVSVMEGVSVADVLKPLPLPPGQAQRSNH